MIKSFNKLSVVLALTLVCLNTNLHIAQAQDSSIEINLDVLDDEEPAAEESEEVVSDDNAQKKDAKSEIELLRAEVDEITKRARARVDAALEEKSRILKPTAPRVDYNTAKPSSTYSSGSYVSPYKSLYDSNDAYKNKNYTPPKPTVSSYEAYLEKYRKSAGEYKPYLSDSYRKPYVPKVAPIAEPPVASSYISPMDTAVSSETPTPIREEKANVTETANVPQMPALPKAPVKYEPLDNYKAPSSATKITAPKIDPIEQEAVKQNIFKSIDAINSIEPPIKRPDLVAEQPKEEHVVAPIAKEKATNTIYNKSLADAAMFNASKDISSKVPSIFDNKAKSTDTDVSSVSEEVASSEADAHNIILDKNIKLSDDIIPDITNASRTEVNSENEVVADKDITNKSMSHEETKIASIEQPAPLPEKISAPKIAEITRAEPSIDDTNQYAKKQVKSIMQPSPVTAASSSSSSEIKEITSPNVYQQRAYESMGDTSSKAIKNITATKSNNSVAMASAKSTIDKAKEVLSDISQNIGDITKTVPKVVEKANSDDTTADEETAKPRETLTSLHFDTNSSELTDALKTELDNTVAFLKESPNIRVQIQAFSHSDNQTKSDARRMSLSRGLAVRSYLTEKGIKPVMLDIRALGDNTTIQPLDRVDIVFLD